MGQTVIVSVFSVQAGARRYHPLAVSRLTDLFAQSCPEPAYAWLPDC